MVKDFLKEYYAVIFIVVFYIAEISTVAIVWWQMITGRNLMDRKGDDDGEEKMET